jgi:lactate dehydrogenase-like 2-hydroxyacid dehydrogenase
VEGGSRPNELTMKTAVFSTKPYDAKPYAVAEFALTLVLALNRRIHRAYDRVRDSNFSIDGLLGSTFTEKRSGSLGQERSGVYFPNSSQALE